MNVRDSSSGALANDNENVTGQQDDELERITALMRLLNYAFTEAVELGCKECAILIQNSANELLAKAPVEKYRF